MAQMKENRKYYFTVEGECEQWYLQWLQNQINVESTSVYKVSLDCPIQKDPVKRAKSLVVTGKTDITHVFDYESDEEDIAAITRGVTGDHSGDERGQTEDGQGE